MSIQFSTELLDDITVEIANRLNTSLGSAATIDFFDGTQPATCAAGDDGTQLASLSLPNPVFGTPSGNFFAMSSVTPGSVSVTGTAIYWRMKDSGTQTHVQGGCADTPGQAILFNTVSWTSAETLQLDSMTFEVSIAGTP